MLLVEIPAEVLHIKGLGEDGDHMLVDVLPLALVVDEVRAVVLPGGGAEVAVVLRLGEMCIRDRAKELLAEAGYPDGFEFTVVLCGTDNDYDLWTLAQEYWAAIGVTCNFETVDNSKPSG